MVKFFKTLNPKLQAFICTLLFFTMIVLIVVGVTFKPVIVGIFIVIAFAIFIVIGIYSAFLQYFE